MRVAAALLATILCGSAAAQTYPQRPVRMIVGLPAGGSTDIMARMVAARLTERIGQTLAETGAPGFHVVGWFGVFTTARTPQPVIARLNADLNAIVKEPDVRERLLATGAEPLSGSPDDLRKHLAREIEVWGKVIREAGVKAE